MTLGFITKTKDPVERLGRGGKKGPGKKSREKRAVGEDRLWGSVALLGPLKKCNTLGGGTRSGLVGPHGGRTRKTCNQ